MEKRMQNAKISQILITLILLNIILVFSPNVITDSQIWENEYGRLEVSPVTSTNICKQTQYAKLNWYWDNSTIDVVFRFEKPIYDANIWIWDNISHDVIVYDYGIKNFSFSLINISNWELLEETPEYIDMGNIPNMFYVNCTARYWMGEDIGWWDASFNIGFDSYEWINDEQTNATFYYDKWGQTGSHIEQNYYYDWKDISSLFSHVYGYGTHNYYISNWNVKQDKEYNFKWQYNVPVGSSGKWILMAKLSSETISEAFTSGHYIELDPWWSSDWSNYRIITIDNAMVDSDMVNVPLLVVFDNTSFAVDSNRSIRFTAGRNSGGTDNITEYAYEIEKWDDTGNCYIWVNVTEVYDATDTVFNMYYNNSDASDGQDADGVWDSNYLGVYHLNQSSGTTCYDSTANNNDGTYVNDVPNRVDGKIGYGQDFDGTTDYITLPVGCYLDDGGFISIWGETDATNADYRFYTQASEAEWEYEYFACGFYGTTGKLASFGHTIGTEEWLMNVDWVLDTDWHYYVLSMATNDVDYFQDTTTIATDDICDMPAGGYDNIRIGIDGADNYDFDGVLDELRVSDIKRNQDWLNITYHTSSQTAGFMTFGEAINFEEPYLSGESPTNGSIDIIRKTGAYVELYVICTGNTSETMTAQWHSNSSGAWVHFGTNITTDSALNITQANINFTGYATIYYWSVNLTDGTFWDNETYHFTTKANTNPVMSDPYPANASTGVDEMTESIFITIADSETLFNWTITTDPDIGSSNMDNDTDGVKTCTLSGIDYDTRYNWTVTANDGVNNITRSYYFTVPQNEPVITSETPVNNSISVIRGVDTTISVYDYQGDTMNITWRSNSSGSWVDYGYNNSIVNGTYIQSFANSTKALTRYYWSVNISGSWTNDTYSFITEGGEHPIISDPIPRDGKERISIYTDNVSVEIADADSVFSYTIETYPDIGSISGTDVGSGVKGCTVSGLNHSTIYTWYVNATDSDIWTNESYTFTTKISTDFDLEDFKLNFLEWSVGAYKVYLGDFVWIFLFIGVIAITYGSSNHLSSTLLAILLMFAAYGIQRVFVDNSEISLLFSVIAAVCIAAIMLGLFLRKKG